MTTALIAHSMYAEVENLIYHLCHQFRRKYGGEFDELVGQANLAFMKALTTYDPDKGEFSKRVSQVVWRELFETIRKDAGRRKKARRVEVDLENIQVSQPLPFQDELSEDARTVLCLALNLPETLRRDARNRGGLKAAGAYCIREYLIGLDWSRKRIMESFQEIREAL